jgi:hypothetical protein
VTKALEDYFKTKKFDFAQEIITNEIKRLITALGQKFQHRRWYRYGNT